MIINPYVFGGGAPPTDPYFGNVISLVHFDGTNGNTGPFDDVVRGSAHWTIVTTGPQLDTSTLKYGTASLSTAGGGAAQGVRAANHTDWDFGSGDFTIEGWVNFNSTAGGTDVITKRIGADCSFLVHKGTTNLQFYASSNGVSFDIASAALLGVVTTGVWYHFAVSRVGNNIYAFLDGVLGSTTVSSATLRVNAFQPSIACQADGTSQTDGFIDDIRVTKGVGRYSAGFTPPTATFPDS